MVLRFRGSLGSIILGSSLALASCAEGTKVDIPMDNAVGGAPAISSGNGGLKSKTNTVGASVGGVQVRSATQTKSGSGGAVGASLGGSTSGTAEGATGGGIGAGGARVSTVSAPTAGLSIRLTQQVASAQETRTDFVLVNFGPGAVDLTNVKIHYYFTIDAWGTPVFEIDDARQPVSNEDFKAALKSSVFSLDPAQPNADRYYELSFSSGTLGSTGEVRIQSRLHEQTWGAMTVSNDYSFTGVPGFTDRVTVYVAGQLVWGIEPGASLPLGTGGATGAAGSPGIGASGGSTGILAGGSGGLENTAAGGASQSTADGTAGAWDGTAGQAAFAGNAGSGN